MARKSKKNAAVNAECRAEQSSACMTAVYVRLSIENSGKDDEGDSIANQTAICKEYLESHAELKLYEIYEDNGKKGTNFERPGFNRMMDDIRSGKVNCVLVKDLSRFGRDYIEVGKYLEKIFPFLGVRFISITDGYDSEVSGDAEDALMIPLKNMINDVYAKDISRKIITSFRARQERGEILPAFAPYGYLKSKTKQYRYEIDSKTAPYVRMIFEWKAAGVTHGEICRRLNEMGAVTPARRKVELGIWKAEKYKHTIWRGRSIIDIMQNLTYTGCIVYGRMPKSLCDGIKMHRADREEWRVLPDMHEPIVSRELYDRVQEIFEANAEHKRARMEASKEERAKQVNLFAGRIFCGDCGKLMRFIKATPGPKCGYPSFACGGYIDTEYDSCSRHGIRYSEVADVVNTVIQSQLETVMEQMKLLQRMKGGATERNLTEQYLARIRYLTQKLSGINDRRKKLYENFMEEIIGAEEYQFAKTKYDEEAAELTQKLEVAKKKKKQMDDVLLMESDWIKALRSAEAVDELNEKLVKSLIRRVLVYEDKRVEVELNYGEQRTVFEQIVQEFQRGDGDHE